MHATEDAKKIEESISWLIGQEEPPMVDTLVGHFGNPILRVRVHLTGDDAGRALSRALAKMPRRLKDEIAADVEAYTDEHSALFLRLDKQKLVEREIAVGNSDAVRLKVKPRSFEVRGRPGPFFSALLEGP